MPGLFYSTSSAESPIFIDPVTFDAATTITAPTIAVAGSTVQGAFTFSNNGSGTLTGAVYFLEVDGGCSPTLIFLNLPTGASASSCSVINGKRRYTFVGMPDTLTEGQAVLGQTPTSPMRFQYTAPASGSIVVTSNMTINETDAFPDNNTATVSTGIGANDVQTTVSVSATAAGGSTVEGAFQFANFGASAANNWTNTVSIGSPGNCPADVTFTSLPAGISLNNYDTSTCQATFTGLPVNLASGQSLNFGFSYTAPASGSVSVNTTINATGDANGLNNSSSGNTIVPVTLSGNVFNDNGVGSGTPENGIKDGTEPGTNASGLNVIIVDATNKVLAVATVANDGSWSAANIASGTDYSAFISTTSASIGTTLAPSAAVASGWVISGENDGINDGARLAIDASSNVTGLNFGIREMIPDVYTTITSPVSVASGDLVNSVLTFGNQGAVTAEGVIYAASLPKGLTDLVCTGATCNYDPATGILSITGLPTSLIPNQSEIVQLSYTAPNNGPLDVTTAIKTTTSNEAITANNTASSSTAVSSSVTDVATWITAPSPTNAGSTVNVPVSFANLGGNTAANVTYTISLPAGLSGVSCTGSGISCSYSGTTVTITGLPTNLAPGQSVDLVLNYIAPSNGYVDITSTANATNDSNPSNNNATERTVITTIVSPPDVLSTLAPPASASGNGTVTVPINYQNLGPGDASIAEYQLTLSGTGVSNVVISNGGTPCVYNSGTGSITGCGLPSVLNPGQSVDLTLTYTAPDSGTVTVSSDITASGETNASNNASSGSTTIIANQKTLSGTVFNDNGTGSGGLAANGLRDGTEAGTNASGLFVVITDSANKVLGVATVNANGNWQTNVVAGTNYRVFLSTTAPTINHIVPMTPALPSGWIFSGENDGVNNGAILGINVSNNISGLNFGIRSTNNVVNSNKPVATIPTLNEWGMFILTYILFVTARSSIRKQNS